MKRFCPLVVALWFFPDFGEFLVFFPCGDFLVFLSVFPFFSRDFRGSVNPCFLWFSLPFSKNQKNPRVRKIRVCNSGAANGSANFMDAWKKCVRSAGKALVHKIPRFRGGGYFGFWGGGGSADFIFMGAGIFLKKKTRNDGAGFLVVGKFWGFISDSSGPFSNCSAAAAHPCRKGNRIWLLVWEWGWLLVWEWSRSSSARTMPSLFGWLSGEEQDQGLHVGFSKLGHTPSTAGTFRKKFRKNSGKTPETLSERFLEFPSRVRPGCPKTRNSRHLRLPERFQNFLPPNTAGDASFFRIGSGEGLSELVMEFPAVLGVFLKNGEPETDCKKRGPSDTLCSKIGRGSLLEGPHRLPDRTQKRRLRSEKASPTP